MMTRYTFGLRHPAPTNCTWEILCLVNTLYGGDPETDTLAGSIDYSYHHYTLTGLVQTRPERSPGTRNAEDAWHKEKYRQASQF